MTSGYPSKYRQLWVFSQARTEVDAKATVAKSWQTVEASIVVVVGVDRLALKYGWVCCGRLVRRN
jgi:hypothetical protein